MKSMALVYMVFRTSRVTFFLVNRVENQNEPKRPQNGVAWVRSGFQLGLRQWEALIIMHLIYGTI